MLTGIVKHGLGSVLSQLEPLVEQVRERAHTESGVIRLRPVELRRLELALQMIERIRRSAEAADSRVTEPGSR